MALHGRVFYLQYHCAESSYCQADFYIIWRVWGNFTEGNTEKCLFTPDRTPRDQRKYYIQVRLYESLSLLEILTWACVTHKTMGDSKISSLTK